MNTNLGIKLLILAVVLLIAIPLSNTGCQEEPKQSLAPLPSELRATLVPNTPLDIYLYASQGSPTTIPAEVLNSFHDINIESLAIWGVPSEDDYTFGMSLAFTSKIEASVIYEAIKPEKQVWKKLNDNIIYLVYGSGRAADTLKTAIDSNDFKYYDDEASLETLATLPSGGINKLAAVAILKPSKALLEFIAEISNTQGSDLANMVMNLMNLKVIACGLYSPRQIDIAELAEIMNSGGKAEDLDMGAVVLIKYGLPTIIVEFISNRFLTQYGFREEQLGDLTVYKGFLNIDEEDGVYLAIRLEDNHIFASISGQESYAENLINSIQIELD